jgi:citrate lyase subunit beta/citryl-CoA lyase
MQLKAARSLLFLPATSPQLLSRATQRGADALIVDLEDAVAPERKAEARELAAQAVAHLAGTTQVLVRVNAEPALLRADVDALPLTGIDAVMLPKVESAQQVQALAALLAGRPFAAPVAIVALIETPLGVMQIQHIATAHSGLVALGFGSEDYAAELGVSPAPQSLSWPAQAVSHGAHAYGLVAWGLPGSIAEIENMDAFGDLVRQSRAFGFTGTVCIHPRQVPVANAAFSPTPEERAWAHKVLAAADAASAAGLAVVSMDGRMLDRPIVERARRLLA